MKFLPNDKQPKPYYCNMKKYFGDIEIKDGLVDITDPCYDKDTWCAMFNYKIKPGKYKCYATTANFPNKYQLEETDSEVIAGIKKAGQIVKTNDVRIIALTIIHYDTKNPPPPIQNKPWEEVSHSIGVDAGMCGFYNHKPNFDDENSWTDFWQNAKHLPRHKWLTCDIKPYGVTVSSGFGDGVYPLFQYKEDGEVVALKLKFD